MELEFFDTLKSHISSTVVGLCMSILLFYMISLLVVLWVPVRYDKQLSLSGDDDSMLRMESSITAISSISTIIVVLSFSRMFSMLGEQLVNILFQVIHTHKASPRGLAKSNVSYHPVSTNPPQQASSRDPSKPRSHKQDKQDSFGNL
jgi:hypothetical protein